MGDSGIDCIAKSVRHHTIFIREEGITFKSLILQMEPIVGISLV